MLGLRTCELALKNPLTLLIGIVLFFTACNNSEGFQADISEGIIEYKVSYPMLDSNDLMLDMMPEKLIMKFKDDRYKTELKAAAGIIETCYIANSTDRTLINMVKIFSDKYAMVLNESQTAAMNELPPFRLEFLEDPMVIAEANCNKVLVDFGIGRDESVFLYYTNEIKLKDPNWCTPFGKIDGVLLDYYLENYNMVMHLQAERIIPAEIDDSEFELPAEYKVLSKEDFDRVVVANLETFME